MCLGFLLVVDYFLMNRFDVPYSIKVEGWRIDPVSILTTLTLVGLWFFFRDHSTYRSSWSEKAMQWALITWFLIALLTTLLHPLDCSPNYCGMACLATIIMWMLPVIIIPRLSISRQDIKVILWTYLVLSGFGVLANVLIIILPDLISALAGWKTSPAGSRAFLPLGVATVLGCIFAMGIPLVIGLYHGSDHSKKIHLASISICLLLIVGILTTGSRATLLVTFLALAVSARMIAHWTIHTPGVKTGIAIILLAVLIGLFLLGQRSRLVSFYDGSIEWRKKGIASAIQMAEDHPILGTGIEKFFHRSSTGRTSELFNEHGMETILYRNRLTAREPHNLYLLTAAETGITGLVCFVLYLAGVLWVLFKATTSTRNEADKALLVGMIISIAIVLLQSLTESMLLARPRFAILIGILWGTYLNYAKVCREETEP